MFYSRSLPDARDEWCRRPDAHLPSLPPTDIVICFHNEAWSALLRTVHSVLDRSPADLVNRVILVDDASTLDHLKKDLHDYMAIYPAVKIVRYE